MRSLIVSLVLILSLSACNSIKGIKLLAPETFGFIQVTPNLYVERGTDAATRVHLQTAILQAEQAIRHTYGSVRSNPVIHACISEQCLQAFGAQGTFAKTYGNRIVLSPLGLNWNFIAHEWSHAELLKRLDLLAWRRLPQWFDEGLAVVVSEAAVHSEQHWQYLQDANIAHPSHAELMGLHRLSAWHEAGRRYSDNQNGARRARGETEIHALYATAGHQVRMWFQQAGTANLLSLIAALNDGAQFNTIYQAD